MTHGDLMHYDYAKYDRKAQMDRERAEIAAMRLLITETLDSATAAAENGDLSKMFWASQTVTGQMAQLMRLLYALRRNVELSAGDEE